MSDPRIGKNVGAPGDDPETPDTSAKGTDLGAGAGADGATASAAGHAPGATAVRTTTTEGSIDTLPPAERAELLAAIEEVAARYPNPRSGVIPALHLAQSRYGWLPTEAFEVVAEGLETSPAFAQSVASFYDMFHLTPTGKHLIEVCTNVACGLLGAGEILDELEEQLGVKAGETTPDGAFTLRTAECLGGCGTAPTVAVNHRYREFFETSQVRPLLTELKATTAGWKHEEGKV